MRQRKEKGRPEQQVQSERCESVCMVNEATEGILVSPGHSAQRPGYRDFRRKTCRTRLMPVGVLHSTCWHQETM